LLASCWTSAGNVMPARDEKRRAYRFGGWELNLRTRRLVSPQGERVQLTNGEFSLLQAFCAASKRILSRDQLLELSRLNRAEVYDRSIDVQILRLRRKIEPDPSHPNTSRRSVAWDMFDVTVDAALTISYNRARTAAKSDRSDDARYSSDGARKSSARRILRCRVS
jgi:DNA-binding winged helix-turn-helix (wHTH) protein